MLLALFLLLSIHFTPCFSEIDSCERLIQDIAVVEYWNARINERLPVTYNHFLQGGYINMPSARMGCEGEIGVGYSSVPPYRNYNLRCQLTDRLEVTGNYRIFRGVDDPILTPLGFGDLSDKGANIKIALFSPEDSDYKLPGIAVGLDDFIGTRNFYAKYIVFTQVILPWNLEASLGYGWHRTGGFFGGISWMPFRKWCPWFLEGFSIVAEYDAVRYKKKEFEKHPDGRVKKTPINFGIKYRLWNFIDLSLSYVRGHALAFSASTYYNFGTTTGFLPKVNDPLPYKAPVVIEPIGVRRPEDVLILDLLFAMQCQGFDLLEASMGCNEFDEQILRLRIVNTSYHSEPEVRTRLNYLISNLVPATIGHVIVVIDAEGFPIQEYHYRMTYVQDFREKTMGIGEFAILTPLCEVSSIPCNYRTIFTQRRDWWNVEIYPRTQTFFGSAKGKFKYALGLNFGLNGFLYGDIYYSIRLGYTFLSDIQKLQGIDRLNPSKLPNVRSDIALYYNQNGITLDEAYLEKSWNLGRGWYSRLSLGYFEIEYGGAATEVLYYPVNCWFAFGAEAAIFRKREINGLGLTSHVRQLDGFSPFHRHFNFSQYFLNLYFNWYDAKLDFKIKFGKFLADDKGVRYELVRYFPSGLRISIWFTMTDGHDKINGKTYYDKGVAFSMPLDIFYTYSDRSRWGYGMSAWLRDVGVIAVTGNTLYETIREERVYD